MVWCEPFANWRRRPRQAAQAAAHRADSRRPATARVYKRRKKRACVLAHQRQAATETKRGKEKRQRLGIAQQQCSGSQRASGSAASQQRSGYEKSAREKAEQQRQQPAVAAAAERNLALHDSAAKQRWRSGRSELEEDLNKRRGRSGRERTVAEGRSIDWPRDFELDSANPEEERIGEGLRNNSTLDYILERRKQDLVWPKHVASLWGEEMTVGPTRQPSVAALVGCV